MAAHPRGPRAREPPLDAGLRRAADSGGRPRVRHSVAAPAGVCAALLRHDVLGRVSPLLAGRLEEELAAAHLYLEIQKIRCGPRLTLDVSADPQTLPLGVPNLLLQPLLENAFEHGVARVPGPVKITLAVRRAADRLEIEITNPIAVGADPRGHGAQGLGLANTRSRIELLFPNEGRCDLALDPAARLARTIVSLPARPIE